MKARSIRRGVAVAATIAGLLATTGLATAPANATEPDGAFTVAFTTGTQLPDSATYDELVALANADHEAQVLHEQERTESDTPDGFRRLDPGFRRSDFIYDSDTEYNRAYKCLNPCVLLAEIKVQLHQVAQGGSSHTWSLKMNMTTSKNPGGISWTNTATYWCGINKTLQTDPLCDPATGAAPSDALMSINTNVYKPWGSVNDITTYPLVEAETQFYSITGNPAVSLKFRGYDTLSRSTTTKLNTKSDG